VYDPHKPTPEGMKVYDMADCCNYCCGLSLYDGVRRVVHCCFVAERACGLNGFRGAIVSYNRVHCAHRDLVFCGGHALRRM